MIFRPTSYDEVSECLRKSSSLSIHSSVTSESSAHDLLSLENFKQILLYEPEEMIVRVQAGITIEELSNQLHDQGQWLPTLVPNENLELIVGAAIANDSYHPRSATLGMLRTTILGGTFAAADGTVYKSGSRVVKSVAGYDIHRAFCGSKGKFGAILDVTLKVQPLPESFVWFESSVDTSRFYPSIKERIDGSVFYELAGFREDINNDRQELSQLSATMLTEQEAHAKIRSIISRHRYPDSSFTPAIPILAAFDPKGVLR